ncbi:glyoxalase bleomycin resistance protein dioxygenase [Leptolyngbya sp. Heron Island J]|uniref:SMU1112c/YaeR family gloxylase I-like metalloprotein n=1 Tax=Leptolyngbya sp. Heron Island J TaxID=1385935 RepID=UPI0003B9655B|nr:VOC family protein [Leptolyngbya sp. Heron Island J]ESA32261.1 glyoxalase bleomycin resistance protein dioxygenase [Leptolyngbya sp. Heron Island J]
MHIKAIHHIAIICSDYARSKQFYVDVLGADIICETWREQRQSYKLDLRLGNGQLELFSFPGPPPRPTRPEACGLRHLALAVENLETQITHLQNHHIDVEPIRLDELTGKRFTFFQDPDGLPLELYEA